MDKRVETDLREQTNLILAEYRRGEIELNQAMKLVGMVFGDYYDFHPEDHPYYAESLKKEHSRKELCAK